MIGCLFLVALRSNIWTTVTDQCGTTQQVGLLPYNNTSHGMTYEAVHTNTVKLWLMPKQMCVR